MFLRNVHTGIKDRAVFLPSAKRQINSIMLNSVEKKNITTTKNGIQYEYSNFD